MIKQLQNLLERRVDELVNNKKSKDRKVVRKLELLNKRNAQLLRTKAKGKVRKKNETDQRTEIKYDVHFLYVIKQKDSVIVEEEVEERTAVFYNGKLMSDKESVPEQANAGKFLKFTSDETNDLTRQTYIYDRLKAVQYAERWWNDYNPAFRKFTDDCTNYISQCLYAGGAPMRGYPNRSQGWWYRGDNWSYSWAVAHSLRWYLGTSKTGLRAREVADPRELQLGDVICYDFEGDGRFNHNTIVTAKDANGMPLVNAHTSNSRMRYWSYEDSTAYTENIQYKFFTIVDDS